MADVNTNTNQETNQQAAQQETNQQDGVQKENTPTIEELTAQNAAERAEKEKNKAALDKALKEIGDLKKQLRAKQTAEEQESEAKKEQEEQHRQYVSRLEEFQKRTMAEKRYMMQGMSAEMAEKAATAEINGDMDELASIQKKHTESLIKIKESEWLKSRPQANAGTGGEGAITKEQFDNMSIAEKSKLYKENKAEYDRLMK